LGWDYFWQNKRSQEAAELVETEIDYSFGTAVLIRRSSPPMTINPFMEMCRRRREGVETFIGRVREGHSQLRSSQIRAERRMIREKCKLLQHTEEVFVLRAVEVLKKYPHYQESRKALMALHIRNYESDGALGQAVSSIPFVVFLYEDVARVLIHCLQSRYDYAAREVIESHLHDLSFRRTLKAVGENYKFLPHSKKALEELLQASA